MEPERRMLLRAWIEAILHHAITRLPAREQDAFVARQLVILEHDFGVRITLSNEWEVEIDYLTDPGAKKRS